MVYINKFEEHSGFTENKCEMPKPNVSLCLNEGDGTRKAHYLGTPKSLTIKAKFFFNDEDFEEYEISTNGWTVVNSDAIYGEYFDHVIVDGVEWDYAQDSGRYMFKEPGMHHVEYVLKPQYLGVVPQSAFRHIYHVTEIAIPNGVWKIEQSALSWISGGEMIPTTVILPDTICTVEDYAISCADIDEASSHAILELNPRANAGGCK